MINSIKTIAEHSFIEEMIDSNGSILDLGSGRMLSFSIPVADYVKKVIAVDVQKPIVDYNRESINFENLAISVKDNEKVKVHKYSDYNAYSTVINPLNDGINNKIDEYEIETVTIKSLQEKYNIDLFEIAKFDIEGAEYEILLKIDKPMSKQLSIEFHDFRGMNYFGENYYKLLFERIGKWYRVVKHEWTRHKGFPLDMGWNYWDSLFILK